MKATAAPEGDLLCWTPLSDCVFASPSKHVARKRLLDRGAVTNGVIGIDPGLGRGFIAEENSFKNTQVSNAIVENNVISDCESAANTPLQYQNCTTFKSFNNQNRGGLLLRAYNNVTAKYLMELEDFTEDVLLGF